MKDIENSKKSEKPAAKIVDQKSTKKPFLPSDELLAVNRDADKVKAVDGNPTA